MDNKIASIASRVAAMKDVLYDSRHDAKVFITMVREDRNVMVYAENGKAKVDILALNEETAEWEVAATAEF